MEPRQKLRQETIDALALEFAKKDTLSKYTSLQDNGTEDIVQFFFNRLDEYLISLNSKNDRRNDPPVETSRDNPFFDKLIGLQPD